MMKTPREILDFIGRDVVQDEIGVSADRVRVAATQDKLPASWLNALERLARRPLPREAFNFKGSM